MQDNRLRERRTVGASQNTHRKNLPWCETPGETKFHKTILFAITVLLTPSMSVSDIDHRAQDSVVGLWVQKRFVREHATVPADMTHAAVLRALQPVPGRRCDVELPIRVVGSAVTSGLIV